MAEIHLIGSSPAGTYRALDHLLQLRVVENPLVDHSTFRFLTRVLNDQSLAFTLLSSLSVSQTEQRVFKHFVSCTMLT